MIKNNRIIANDAPKNLYHQKPEHYVAALFDDVNELVLEGKMTLLYPNDIQIVKNSEHQASVITSYFKGYHWLIEAVFNEQKVFIKSNVSINSGDAIYLNFVSIKQ